MSDGLDGEDAMIFRLSHKLNAKVKAGTLGALPLHENPLLDWSAHVFVAGRVQYILLSNTKSLYSAVLPGKGITSERRFTERALGGVRDLLQGEGQESAYRRFIAPASASARFARALDRSVTGSMKELITSATYWLAEGELSAREVGTRLNEVLLSALAQGKSGYGRPRDALKALLRQVELEAPEEGGRL